MKYADKILNTEYYQKLKRVGNKVAKKYLAHERDIMKKRKRNQFEKKLDEYNHTMELIRTVIPFFILVIQIVILIKLF
jgi:archaellum component FlaD/FlaE